MTPLVFLSALGVGWVVWITLAPTCTPVTAAMYAMGVVNVTLDYSITPLPVVVVAIASTSVL